MSEAVKHSLKRPYIRPQNRASLFSSKSSFIIFLSHSLSCFAVVTFCFCFSLYMFSVNVFPLRIFSPVYHFSFSCWKTIPSRSFFWCGHTYSFLLLWQNILIYFFVKYIHKTSYHGSTTEIRISKATVIMITLISVWQSGKISDVWRPGIWLWTELICYGKFTLSENHSYIAGFLD